MHMAIAAVLIETLWNVKIHHERDSVGVGSVLIETLWNVKTVTTASISSSSEY